MSASTFPERTFREGWESLQKRVNKAEERIKELEEAIRKHRRDTWGQGAVGHPHDVELYVALKD